MGSTTAEATLTRLEYEVLDIVLKSDYHDGKDPVGHPVVEPQPLLEEMRKVHTYTPLVEGTAMHSANILVLNESHLTIPAQNRTNDFEVSYKDIATSLPGMNMALHAAHVDPGGLGHGISRLAGVFHQLAQRNGGAARLRVEPVPVPRQQAD